MTGKIPRILEPLARADGPDLTYYLCLGSNLGDRRAHLARAVQHLEASGVRVANGSSIYETEPVDFADQPWFLNQVLEVRTRSSPYDLLRLVKTIEARMKRKPAFPKGPRTIDIDILLAEDTIIDTPELSIPHPRLAARNFVLVPLAEIAPDVVHPIFHQPVRQLARACSDEARVAVWSGRSVPVKALRPRRRKSR